jgi:RimJ/RimL family protein N-acetyltransferase
LLDGPVLEEEDELMNAPEIITDRLMMRRHLIDDFDASLAMWSDPAVTRYIGGRPSTAEEVWSRLLRYVGHWELLGYGYWVVVDRASQRFAGEVGFADFRREINPPLDAPEAGWVLASWAAGNGLATEAMIAALRWADAALSPARTVCMIAPGNAASLRVAGKVGYRLYAKAEYKGSEVALYERTADRI